MPFGKKDYAQISLDDFSDDDDSVPEDSRTNNEYRDYRNGHQPDPLQRQQQLMQEQDHGLEMLGKSAERLGQLSMQISDELGFQNKVLDDMDTDLDTASENLDFVTRKTKKFIQLSGGVKNCVVILVLTVVVIILILLILYV